MARPKLLIASTNSHKVAELRRLLGALAYDLVTPGDLGLRLEVTEDGATYRENAALKVLWGLRRDPMHFESIAEKVDPSGFSFMSAYFRVWGEFVKWRNNLLEEEESNGSSEEARERQTEEPQ